MGTGAVIDSVYVLLVLGRVSWWLLLLLAAHWVIGWLIFECVCACVRVCVWVRVCLYHSV